MTMQNSTTHGDVTVRLTDPTPVILLAALSMPPFKEIALLCPMEPPIGALVDLLRECLNQKFIQDGEGVAFPSLRDS
jgi:hypothetical protein